jgi:hypothetical protein
LLFAALAFFSFLSLLSAGVQAQDGADLGFSIDINATKATIYPDEAAYFRLVVKNEQNRSDAFVVSTEELDWVLDTTEILSDIPPGGEALTFIQLSPKTDITPGVKLVRIKVRSANNREFIEELVLVSVRSAGSEPTRQYAPSVFLSARTPEQVDPREPLTLSIYLRNRNARDFPALTVRVSSDLFAREYVTTLGPVTGDDGEKTNQLQIPVDPVTPPGTHSIRITINDGNTTINTYETTYEILGYTADTRSVESTTSFFKTTTYYTVSNSGNIPDTVAVEHPTSFLRRLFTSSTIASEAMDGRLVSTVLLEPRTSVTVEVVENYRLLVIFGVLVVLCILAYFILRSPVVITKEARLKGGDGEGVTEMRIRLHLKCRGAKQVHNLHVVDRITSMADVVKEATLGTLQPTKILKKPGHGTLVRWDIDTLEPFEERIISYTVKTKLELIGDVYLPAAKVTFEQRRRARTTYSNEVNIPREN